MGRGEDPQSFRGRAAGVGLLCGTPRNDVSPAAPIGVVQQSFWPWYLRFEPP
jgi:hypothetical protein